MIELFTGILIGIIATAVVIQKEPFVLGLHDELDCEPQNMNTKGWKFQLGDLVEKIRGSGWHGTVVGFYTTEATERGYAVESMLEVGSVQIYPEAALRAIELPPKEQ